VSLIAERIKVPMTCHNCQIVAVKLGKDRYGSQRYRCNKCRKTFGELKDKPLGTMRIKFERALLCLQLLLEGNSIRSTQRITGLEKRTILNLLVLAGEKCEAVIDQHMKRVVVKELQLDEIWTYVGMKEKTKTRKHKDSEKLGDAYCFVAFERDSKLVLTHHLGKRTERETYAFTEKIFKAIDGTTGEIQITTDGFPAYPNAIDVSLGSRSSYAQMIKIYGQPIDDDHKYSPSKIKEIITHVLWGDPNLDRICTSHVERQNLNIRMALRRFTRLTNAFSKKWSNLSAMLALYFAYYNFCRIHSSIRCTPAMEAGITKRVWELRDLLAS
jgi:transposase-like protein/IS1 family transposase